jgi:hypothetical protein
MIREILLPATGSSSGVEPLSPNRGCASRNRLRSGGILLTVAALEHAGTLMLRVVP